MPNYKIEFEREWIERDRVERVIFAVDEAEAQAIADTMAVEFDADCPDDVEGSKDGEATAWVAGVDGETDEPLSEDEDEMTACECGADVDTTIRSQCDECGRTVTA